MSLKAYIHELNGIRVEGELIKTLAASLATSFAALGILYYLKLRFIPNFAEKYAVYLFLAAISYALIVSVIRQVRAYSTFACMSGMMIGMTTGMIAGVLSGFYVGATNGMFAGSVFGMAVGIIVGTWAGSCCGIMGFLEGIMAGFMGGLMGAMTALMLYNDHLVASAVIIFAISSVILLSLNYFIFLEAKESDRQRKENYFLTILLSLALIISSASLMVFGPRSVLFA